MSLENEDIKVKITGVGGDDPKYDAWSIDAKAWIGRNGEKKFVKKIALNVLKDDGEFEKDDDGIPHVAHRIKESYKDVVKEDPGYKPFSVQTLENEKQEARGFEGEEFEF